VPGDHLLQEAPGRGLVTEAAQQTQRVPESLLRSVGVMAAIEPHRVRRRPSVDELSGEAAQVATCARIVLQPRQVVREPGDGALDSAAGQRPQGPPPRPQHQRRAAIAARSLHALVARHLGVLVVRFHAIQHPGRKQQPQHLMILHPWK